ncbi:Protein NRT1/ PTR FAMILY 4.2 [Clarias magur]|uniref:Protein NRT1/ PTR FAMILY 4.2 n=1 Tax=Clarias magur TaxID=1594786 RepID=A0A8J4T431_CLAMG|nr:Protein NRT1/ PTR FAMILY 4.2 [Clarias magur]
MVIRAWHARPVLPRRFLLARGKDPRSANLPPLSMASASATSVSGSEKSTSVNDHRSGFTDWRGAESLPGERGKLHVDGAEETTTGGAKLAA